MNRLFNNNNKRRIISKARNNCGNVALEDKNKTKLRIDQS